MLVDFLFFLARRVMPKKLVYFCGIQIWCEATSGKYGDTNCPSILMAEAITRYARIHGLRGHGADKHYDSNRTVK